MRTIKLAWAALAIVPAVSMGQRPTVEFELDSPLFSKYVWRGLNVVDGPVWQPSVTASLDAWSLNLWGNFEIGDTNDYGPGFGSGRGKFTEVDTTLEYSATSGEWDWSVGYIRYDFPNTGLEGTSELFASFSLAGEWSPTLQVYTDIGAANGTYANVSAGKQWDAKDGGEFGFDVGVGVCTNGHNAYYFGIDKSGLVDLGMCLSYTRALSESSFLTVSASYSSLLDKALTPGSGKRDNFVFGVGLTFGF